MQNCLHNILLLFFLLWPSFADAELVDRIVAEVNDDVITLSELEKAGDSYFERIRAKAPARELDLALQQAREEVLASLIEKTLLRQAAAKISVTVSEAEIDSAIDTIKSVLIDLENNKLDSKSNLPKNQVTKKMIHSNKLFKLGTKIWETSPKELFDKVKSKI